MHNCCDQSTVHCTDTSRVADLLLSSNCHGTRDVEPIPKSRVDSHIVLTKRILRLDWCVEVRQWIVFDEPDGRVDEDDCRFEEEQDQ